MSSSTAHTAGPWSVTSRAGYTGHGVSAGSKRVCSINANSTLQKEERDANARLIAAGPELLAVLERANRLCSEALPKFNWGNSALDANALQLLNEVPNEIRAAIAAAKGGA